MYEAEHEQIKEVLEKSDVKHNSNLIAIKDDYSHIYKIKEAFKRKELVVMHGDRFLEGANTIEMTFMNETAEFPTGPLYLASKNNALVSFVYAIKESSTHYHFYATKAKHYAYPAKIKTRNEDLKNMLKDYIKSLETIINKYPTQWFNYYPFWKQELKQL